MDNNAKIKKALTKIVKDILKNDSEYQACFRVYLAKVTVPPSPLTKKCSVRLISQQTDITIPFSSACSDCSAGDMVLVGTTSNSFRNAVVWEKYNYTTSAGGGGGGTTDHRQLTNRNAADQHPISSITGLTTALDDKQNKNIEDEGDYFETDTVEGALQEIGAEITELQSSHIYNIEYDPDNPDEVTLKAQFSKIKNDLKNGIPVAIFGIMNYILYNCNVSFTPTTASTVTIYIFNTDDSLWYSITSRTNGTLRYSTIPIYDEVVTSSSVNAVQSGVIYAELAKKQDKPTT